MVALIHGSSILFIKVGFGRLEGLWRSIVLPSFKFTLDVDSVPLLGDKSTDAWITTNINLDSFKQGNVRIYLIIEDRIIFDNFKEQCIWWNLSKNYANYFKSKTWVKNI